MIGALYTGSGVWNPIIWTIVFIISILVTYIIKSFGRSGHKEEGEKTEPFLAGNIEKDPNKLFLRSENLYWGFIESLRGYYRIMERYHTGDIRDYILWFVIVIIVLFVVGVI